MEQELIDKIDVFPEHECYFLIEECGGFIFHMNHEIGHGRIQSTPGIEQDILNVREIQEYVVSKLNKFGVDPASALLSRNDGGDYWKWFEFWHNWHFNELTDEEWNEIGNRLESEESIEEFLPKNKWNDLNL
jgi:hypothetical protein